MQRRIFVSIYAIALGAPLFACSGAPEADPRTRATAQAIYGGSAVEGDAWPSVVWLEPNCSGVLLHRRLVAYAGHCGDSYPEVVFGGDAAGARTVSTLRCEVHPDNSLGSDTDIGFCLLAEPVTDVPIIPLILGCELGAIAEEQEVTVVGFGHGEDGAPHGIKRAARTRVHALEPALEVGGNGVEVCAGDSGGPALLRLSSEQGYDDTYRVIGIASAGRREECDGSPALYARAWVAIDWLERASRLSLRPCFDTRGDWAPTPRCRAPGDDAGVELVASGSCGPVFERAHQEAPPIEFRIAQPADGARLQARDLQAGSSLVIELSDTTALDTLLITIWDTTHSAPAWQAPIELAPFIVPLPMLPPGQFRIEAVATTFEGTRSAREVSVTVDPDAPAQTMAASEAGGSCRVLGSGRSSGRFWLLLVYALVTRRASRRGAGATVRVLRARRAPRLHE